MSRKGGKRPGAGRKKGSKNKVPRMTNEAKELLHEQVMQYWTPLIQTKIAVALGDYYVEKMGKTGKRFIYKQAPNSQAINDLLEFVVGKPTQKVDNNLSGSVDTPGVSDLASNIAAILSGKKSMTVQAPQQAATPPDVKSTPRPEPAKEPLKNGLESVKAHMKEEKPTDTPRVLVDPPKPIENAAKRAGIPVTTTTSVQQTRNFTPLNPALILKK